MKIHYNHDNLEKRKNILSLYQVTCSNQTGLVSIIREYSFYILIGFTLKSKIQIIQQYKNQNQTKYTNFQ